MNCCDVRRLLTQGVVPGSADSQRALLGFHLCACPACRAFRSELEHTELLQSLLAQSLPAPIAPVPHRPAHRRYPYLRGVGAALLVGGTCMLVSGAAPFAYAAPMAAPHAVAAAEQHASKAAAVHQNDQALLAALLERPSATSHRAAVAAERMAEKALTPGQELTIPALEHVASAAPAQQGAQSYVVQPGDTLSAIALRFYNNAGLWSVIYQANEGLIRNPNLIYPNQRLTIPAATGQQPQPPQSGQGPGQYTVVRGDTLSGIAYAVYGNASRWNDIYAANRGVIGGNPGLIYPGTVLTIPR